MLIVLYVHCLFCIRNHLFVYSDDMEMMLNKIVPEGLPYRHSCEGPDDMVRCVWYDVIVHYFHF